MARVFTDGGAMKLISGNTLLTVDANFSLAFWLYRTGTPVAQRSLITLCDTAVANGWIIRLTTGNLINAAIPYSTTDKQRNSTTVPALNTWVPVVITHNQTGLASTDFQFYFNGKQEAGTDVATAVGAHDTATASPLEVGASTGTALTAPPANIGPIALWNRAISPAEALALATGAHPLRFKEGLVELFDMEKATGEEGCINRFFLAQGATNPTSAAVNPVVERVPLWLPEYRQNIRPMARSRARYIANTVAGGQLPWLVSWYGDDF